MAQEYKPETWRAFTLPARGVRIEIADVLQTQLHPLYAPRTGSAD